MRDEPVTGRWGWSQPITIPESGQMELYWQSMPDETEEELKAEFFEWWREILDHRPDLFALPPKVEMPAHWLPGCSLPSDSPLVSEFAATAAGLGLEVPVEGLDAPTDVYIFQRWFDTPAVLWGPSGGNAHKADEYVDLESLFEATRTLLHFVRNWCGLARK